jgi:hypothetical protein
MTVSRLHLVFAADGRRSPPVWPAARDRDLTVDLALRSLVAAHGGPYAHEIHCTMADGSRVVARARGASA